MNDKINLNIKNKLDKIPITLLKSNSNISIPNLNVSKNLKQKIFLLLFNNSLSLLNTYISAKQKNQNPKYKFKIYNNNHMKKNFF